MDHRPVQSPNPLYMLIKNMHQNEHGDRPYAGNLGGGQEYVFENAYGREEAVEQAQAWIENERSGYTPSDTGTLIEIHEFATLAKGDSSPTEIVFIDDTPACGDTYHFDRYET